MPKIPVIPEQIGLPRVNVGPAAAPVDAAADAGTRALGQFGGAAAQLGGELLARDQEAEAVAWVARALSETRATWTERYRTASTSAAAGAPDFTRGLLQGVDDDFAQRLEGAPNPRARALAQARFAAFRDHLHGQAFGFEMQQRQALRVTTAEDLVARAAGTVRGDPGQAGPVLAETLGAIAALPDLTPDRRADLSAAARRSVAEAELQARIDRDPAAARAALAAGRFHEALGPGRAEALLGQAEAALRRNAGDARAAVTAGYAEDLAAVAATGQGAGAGGAFRVSDAQIRAAHPNDPLEAERLIEARRAAARASLIDQRLQGTTPAERAALAAEARAGIGAAAEDDFERRAVGAESAGNPRARNAQGYVGLYQFGAARLAELGFYRPLAGEDASRNEWRGRFAVPGHPGVQNLQQFLDSPAAQQAAWRAHVARIDRAIDEGGLLERFGGRTIGGTAIDRGAMRGMAHLGGTQGMIRYLESGGAADPADANGTRLSDYAARFAGSAGDGLRPGVAARTRLAELTEQRVAAYEEQLRTRPGELAARQPAIAALFADADREPAALQTAIATSLDWQRNAGVAAENLQPLPPAAATTLARRYDQAATPRDRLDLLLAAAGDDPAIADRVLRQLRGAGGSLTHRVPEAAALALAVAAEPGRRATAERLLAELSTPLRDLNDGAPGDRAALAAAVDGAFGNRGGWFSGAALGGVLARQYEATQNPGYGERYGTMRSAVEHVARVRALAGGDVAAAARAAAEDFAGHLAVVDEPGAALAHYPAWIAPAARMADGFAALRARIPELLAPFRPGDADRVAQQQFDRFAADAAANGVWINDGEGFALIVPGTGRALAAGGEVWRVFAHEVAAAGAAAPRRWDPVSDRMEPGG